MSLAKGDRSFLGVRATKQCESGLYLMAMLLAAIEGSMACLPRLLQDPLLLPNQIPALIADWTAFSSCAFLLILLFSWLQYSNSFYLSFLLSYAVILLLAMTNFTLIPKELHQYVQWFIFVVWCGAFLILVMFYLRYKHQSDTTGHRILLWKQICGHFLFNSLNNNICLIHSHPQKAEENLILIIDIFHSIRETGIWTSWEKEIEITKQYLTIEEARTGKKVPINWSIGKIDLKTPIIPLFLQPLVENSIFHNPGGRHCPIGVTIQRLKEQVKIMVATVRNNKPRNTNRLSGITHNNLQKRLRLAYGKHFTFDINDSLEQYLVTVHIPHIPHISPKSSSHGASF